MTTRMITGYIVRIVFEDQKVSYHGPFLTEDRANSYVFRAYGIVDHEVLPLVIPHTLHVIVEDKATN